MDALRFVLVCMAGWMNRNQQLVIEYLQEEVKILKDAGIEPSPDRKNGLSWEEFLRRHWDVIAATDFFTVEVWTLGGLVRYHVLFVIKLATRKVEIAGIVPEPNGIWMKQIARNLTDCADGFLIGYEHLIHDRGTQFTKEFRSILGSAGVKSLRFGKTKRTAIVRSA